MLLPIFHGYDSFFGISYFRRLRIGLQYLSLFLGRLHPRVQSSRESVRVATHPLKSVYIYLPTAAPKPSNTIFTLVTVGFFIMHDLIMHKRSGDRSAVPLPLTEIPNVKTLDLQ